MSIKPRQPTIADLPETARVFASIIGFAPTLRLARKSQHKNISIPKSIGHKHWIAITIGNERAALLARHFGGCLMPLAKCRDVNIAMRQDAIVSAYKAGTSPALIAAHVGESVRTVLNDLDRVGLRRFAQPRAPVSPSPRGLGTSSPAGKRGGQTGA